MMSSKKKEEYLKDTINAVESTWQVLVDTYVNYPEADVEFHMYVVMKI